MYVYYLGKLLTYGHQISKADASDVRSNWRIHPVPQYDLFFNITGQNVKI